MFKRVNNWHLSVLVVIVSIFSLAVVQQYAEAQWQEPGALPGGTPANNLVVHPMIEDLQIGGQRLIGTYLNIDADNSLNDNKILSISDGMKLCLNDDCIAAWPSTDGLWTDHLNGVWYADSVGIGVEPDQNYNLTLGGATKGSLLQLKHGLILNTTGDLLIEASEDVYFNNKVGIGTNSPNKNLHILSPSGENAEIDIQSGSEAYWGIYQDETTADLRFWNGNNRVTFTDDGRVGIGTIDIDSDAYLHVDKGPGENYAAWFNGNVILQHNTGEPYNYLQIDHLSLGITTPPEEDCDGPVDKGRMIYSYANKQLHICDGVWLSVTLN